LSEQGIVANIIIDDSIFNIHRISVLIIPENSLKKAKGKNAQEQVVQFGVARINCTSPMSARRIFYQK
jgi:hypothetical protein